MSQYLTATNYPTYAADQSIIALAYPLTAATVTTAGSHSIACSVGNLCRGCGWHAIRGKSRRPDESFPHSG